jgi:MFS family permease
VLAVAPAYMGDASLTNEDIEKLFFVFGTSRFATMLLFESRISAYLELALTLAMSAMAVGMLISFASTSIVSFAVAITFFGLATSIFYPVSFTLVTRNTPCLVLVEPPGQ